MEAEHGRKVNVYSEMRGLSTKMDLTVSRVNNFVK